MTTSAVFDRCEFATRKREINPINEDVSELITYYWCIYIDDAGFKHCPYPERYCLVKHQTDRLSAHLETAMERKL